MKKIYVSVTVVVVAMVVVLATIFPAETLSITLDAVKDLVKSIAGTIVGLGASAAIWYGYENRKWGGWSLQVTNRNGEEIRKPLPPSVIKRWMKDKFSDFEGFRDLTGSINRWPDCGLVTVDADKAKQLLALWIEDATRTVHFNYKRLPAVATGPR